VKEWYWFPATKADMSVACIGGQRNNHSQGSKQKANERGNLGKHRSHRYRRIARISSEDSPLHEANAMRSINVAKGLQADLRRCGKKPCFSII
jgi:hypothetical protein